MAKAKNYVPEGLRSLNAHLTIKDCAKAIEFYKRAFGATEVSRYNGPDGGIMHATIRIGDSVLMLNDEFLPMNCKGPLTIGGTPVSISLYVPNVDEVYSRAVAEGAKATMPVSDMFWGDRYGMLVDPFGHQWEIATHIEDLSPAELKERGEKAMAEMKAKA
jgi:uncharacterized glyoxalase superfamily protein PhnB